MKTTIFALSLTVLSAVGCSQKVTEVPGLDRVLTTSEFTAQTALREQVLRFCANDPGRYRLDPNCLNSQQSLRTTFVGSGNFPSLDSSPITLDTGKKQ